MKTIIIIGFFMFFILLSVIGSNITSLLVKSKIYETEDKKTLTFKEALATISSSSVFRNNPKDEYQLVDYKSVVIHQGIFFSTLEADTLKSTIRKIDGK